MAVTDWIANLFQSEQTRGLSGGGTSTAVALDESNPFYNYRLRRHVAEGDLVGDPGLLWYTSPYVKRRSGLGTHIATERSEGIAHFTDVLLILSLEDYSRAVSASSEPWLQLATRVLLQEFDEFCGREGYRRLFTHRPLGFRIICDGSADMSGQALGLKSGEFVTGLLPNLYSGPVAASVPIVGIHLNIPGAWEGYREVGRLHNDQVLFTLGSHWLDNYSHPLLRESALYRLQQYPDGTFVHIISPDLQDQFQVTSTDQDGASVLTVATRDGEPVAYVVLALMDETADSGDASIPPPMMLEEGAQSGLLGSRTIIPDAPSERIFTLQERGALLQKVHFSKFMQGYQVYLGTRGELGTVVEDKAATFQVRKRQVAIVAHVEGIKVEGHPVAKGVEIPIEGDVVIQAGGQRLEYRDLRGLDIDGWPYVGEIRRPASSNYMLWGEIYRVGRSRECRVVLPDEPRNDNIVWEASVADGATIRARRGDIPKSNFYTDSIMVASEHASVDLSSDVPRLLSLARHCYSYIRRDGEYRQLCPTSSGRQPIESELQPGDEILVGNCLFHVGFTPAEDAVVPAPAPRIEISPDALVEAVSFADPEEAEAVAPPPPPPGADDAPAAFGLGESGMAPTPVHVERVGMDSILGVLPDEAIDGEAEDDDQPTIPGASLPREIQGAIDREAERMDARSEGGLPPLPAGIEVEWDDESWTGTPGAKNAPADLGEWEELDSDQSYWEGEASGSHTIPPPFPDVEENPKVAPPALPDADEPMSPPPVDESPPQRSVDAPPPIPADDAPPPVPEAPAPAPVAEEPPPIPAPPEPAPAEEAAPAPEPSAEPVVVHAVDDADAQFELGRPMHLVQVGWMVKGKATLGNNSGADLILAENRLVEGQEFTPRDYLEFNIRGRRTSMKVLAPGEVFVNEQEPDTEYSDLSDILIEVIRRDDQGEEDFSVAMTLLRDRSLPDPRARLLRMDDEDDLALALITRGLPQRTDRRMSIEGFDVTMRLDGAEVALSDYLGSYRQDDGFFPFFVQHGEDRFQTAPEDGSPFVMRSGDRLIIGVAVYLLRES